MLQSSNQDLGQRFHPSKVPCNQHRAGTWPEISSEKLKPKVCIKGKEDVRKKQTSIARDFIRKFEIEITGKQDVRKKQTSIAKYLISRLHWTVHFSKLDTSNCQLQNDIKLLKAQTTSEKQRMTLQIHSDSYLLFNHVNVLKKLRENQNFINISHLISTILSMEFFPRKRFRGTRRIVYQVVIASLVERQNVFSVTLM